MIDLLYILACIYVLYLTAGIPSLFKNLRKKVSRGRGGYLYAFTDWGQLLPVVKIGRATDSDQRLSAHRTAAPFGLRVFFVIRVPDTHYAERYLHLRYATFRVRSNGEWFWRTPGILFELLIIRLFFRA